MLLRGWKLFDQRTVHNDRIIFHEEFSFSFHTPLLVPHRLFFSDGSRRASVAGAGHPGSRLIAYPHALPAGRDGERAADSRRYVYAGAAH